MAALDFKKHRLIAQLLFWSFYALIIVLVGINFAPLKHLLFFLAVNLVLGAVAVYANYIFLLPLVFEKKYVRYGLGFFALIIGINLFWGLIRTTIIQDSDPRPIWNIVVSQFVFLTTLVVVSSTYKFFEEWLANMNREATLANEKLAAELQFLKNQVNPHFIFNTLNNIYSLSYRKHPNATPMIALLSDIMRYLLHDCSKKKVSVQKEVELIAHYIQLQTLSKGENIRLDFYHEGVEAQHEMAPMLFINFVENSFKYSNIGEEENAWINIQLSVDQNVLQFSIENSVDHIQSAKPGNGIGLTNTKRQLELTYPGAYNLKTTREEDIYSVQLTLKL